MKSERGRLFGLGNGGIFGVNTRNELLKSEFF